MKRIIEEVLQAEERVGAIINDARDRAAEIKRSAEKEISQKTSDAKQKGREMVQTAVEEAKKEAERISKDKIELIDHQKDALLNNRAAEIDNLVGEICEMILTTECEKDSN
ncbi:MAG: hypothetical protein H8E73_05600 [Planctomycetes bacterium]|jgi:vacuolar-type H+-ATPase subunit H|nr:hypothetical protein [Planctomycetota bacterium]